MNSVCFAVAAAVAADDAAADAAAGHAAGIQMHLPAPCTVHRIVLLSSVTLYETVNPLLLRRTQKQAAVPEPEDARTR